MVVSSVVVVGRQARRRDRDLGIMRGSDGGVVPSAGPHRYTYWSCRDVLFQGAALLRDAAGGRIEARIAGVASLAVGEGRVVGIVDPADTTRASAWFSWDLPEVTPEPVGRRGLWHRRPRGLVVVAAGAGLALLGVSQVFDAELERGAEDRLLRCLRDG